MIRILRRRATRASSVRSLLALATALAALGAGVCVPVETADAAAPTYTVTTSPGPTPFIADVVVHGVDVGRLTSASFSIVPQAGSTTRPVSAGFNSAYLASHSRLDPVARTVAIPVFGLYASASIHSNSVKIRLVSGRSVSSMMVTVATTPWVDPTGGAFTSPDVITPRNNKVRLGYSYFAVKPLTYANPIVFDTDGQVRWVAPVAPSPPKWYPSSIFIYNAFYLGTGSSITRMELDGSTSVVGDYSTLPEVDSVTHHNYDAGKDGILVEVSSARNIASSILEVSRTGAVLNRFDLDAIVRDAMIAGGDDPSGFVRDGVDWFHNNAATYWRAYDELVVSGREEFVIGIDWSTKKIKWILGDPTKAWYGYPSLRKFALALPAGTTAPVGQHAVSIADNKLVLFDNGYPSMNENPVGAQRTYSVARMYRINRTRRTATEVWNFEHGRNLLSNFCSSVYRVGSTSLVEYAFTDGGPRVVGLGADNSVAFEYRYPGDFHLGWNAVPVSFSGLSFSGG